VTSNRPERIGEAVRDEISLMLAREVHDPGIGFVTLTRVKVTPDLQIARVYYTTLGDEKAQRETAKALRRAAPFLRRQLGQKIRLRRVPEIEFHYDESIAHARSIISATDLPVAADLEHGFGDDPVTVSETIRLAAEIGLVGGSIEDARGYREKPIYDIQLATERVAAAVEIARSLPFPFTLAARAENFVHGKADLDDTIKRLVAYEAAGADVLFAPGLPNLAAVREVCSAVSKPVNFAVGGKDRSFTVAELVHAGVKRISFAASFYRAAMAGLIDAAREAQQSGTFTYLQHTITTADLNRFFPD